MALIDEEFEKMMKAMNRTKIMILLQPVLCNDYIESGLRHTFADKNQDQYLIEMIEFFKSRNDIEY